MSQPSPELPELLPATDEPHQKFLARLRVTNPYQAAEVIEYGLRQPGDRIDPAVCAEQLFELLEQKPYAAAGLAGRVLLEPDFAAGWNGHDPAAWENVRRQAQRTLAAFLDRPLPRYPHSR